MSLFVQTNLTSLKAQENFSKTEVQLGKTMQKLSSGYKINSAADDAGGLGASMRLKSQLGSYTAATQNANTAIAMTQTADGGASQISDILTRLSQLAVEGASGTLSTADSANLDQEFQAQLTEITNIAANTTYNGTSLLSGSAAATTFQVGIGTSSSDAVSVSFGGADASGLGLSGNVLTAGGAATAMTQIKSAIDLLSGIRAGFGAGMNALADTVSNLGSMSTNTAGALSAIQDVDVAATTAQLSQQQVMSQAGEAILAQANQMPQLAVSLIHNQ
jgi:flagellin